MRAAMIGRAHLVAVAVGQGALDGVGVPSAAFVQQGGCHRPEAVGRHFVAGEPQPPQARVDRVFRHGPGTGSDGWKDIASRASDGPQLAEQVDRLARKGNAVLPLHFHLGGGNDPYARLKVDFALLGMAQLAGAHENMGG